MYFFLGAQEIDSEGEYEWYMFLDLLFPTHSPLEIGAWYIERFDDDAAMMMCSFPHSKVPSSSSWSDSDSYVFSFELKNQQHTRAFASRIDSDSYFFSF